MLNGFIGGVMIGCSAVLLMGLMGRIAGISGMITGIFSGSKFERLCRLLFMIGLIAAPALLTLAGFPVEFDPRRSPTWLILSAGVLVGLGTRVSNGCTSGHGVCGLARLSPRSAVAVATFLSTAMLTIFIARHVLMVGAP
jgi:uncharacterized membrane protein YedE/YeeE